MMDRFMLFARLDVTGIHPDRLLELRNVAHVLEVTCDHIAPGNRRFTLHLASENSTQMLGAFEAIKRKGVDLPELTDCEINFRCEYGKAQEILTTLKDKGL